MLLQATGHLPTAMASRSLRLHLNAVQAVDATVFDRYSTIRSFFKRQAHPVALNIHHGTPAVTSQLRTACFPRYTGTVTYNIGFQPRLATRSFHTFRRREEDRHGRTSGSGPGAKDIKNDGTNPSQDGKRDHPPDVDRGSSHGVPHFENYSRFFRQLAMTLPPMHRPTRDDFLNVATNFWQRLRIRFKWLTIRSFRKFNADDMSAFITWFLMSQTLWILVGT